MATLNLVKKSDCFRFLFVTIVLLFVFFFLSALFFILIIFLIYYLFTCFSSPITLFLGVFEVERSEVVVAVKTSRSETGRTLLLCFCLFVCLFLFFFLFFFLILKFYKAFLFFFSYACLSVCLYVCNISFFDIIKVGHLQNV